MHRFRAIPTETKKIGASRALPGLEADLNVCCGKDLSLSRPKRAKRHASRDLYRGWGVSEVILYPGAPYNLPRALQGKKVPEDHADRGAWTRMQDARHGLPTLRPASARRGFARAGLLA